MDGLMKLAVLMTFLVFVLHIPTILCDAEVTPNASLTRELEDYFKSSHQSNARVTHWPQDKMKFLPKIALQILNGGRPNGLVHKNVAKVLYNLLTNESTFVGMLVKLVVAQLENLLGYELTIVLVRDLVRQIDQSDFGELLKPVWEKIKYAHVGISEDFDTTNDSQNEKPTLEDAFKIVRDIMTDEKALEFMSRKLEDPNEEKSYATARFTYFSLKEIEEERMFNLQRKTESLQNDSDENDN